MSQLKIREMPAQERPREKLLARGVSALSDAELIAILLRTGLRGTNAVEVGRQLLERYKSLTGISRCSVKELRRVPRRLAEAAELLQIKLLDHIIIGAPSEGSPGYFSFKEAGVL